MLPEHHPQAALERQLEIFLVGRTTLLGIGSRWWRDDGAGSHIAQSLENCEQLDAINAGFVPENYLETVASKKPDSILLVDTVDFGGEPGEARLMHPRKVAMAGLSTHAGSLQMLARYLQNRTGAGLAVLAIQPEDTHSGEGLTPAVAETAVLLEKMLPELCEHSRPSTSG